MDDDITLMLQQNRSVITQQTFSWFRYLAVKKTKEENKEFSINDSYQRAFPGYPIDNTIAALSCVNSCLLDSRFDILNLPSDG